MPAGRFRFGDLVRMEKKGTEADTPLQTVLASGPFKIEVGCYDDAGKTGGKVVISSSEPKSMLGFWGYEEGTTRTETWSVSSFEAFRDFVTLIAPSGAAVGAIFQVVHNGLGSDCAYLVQYTTNR